jgi:hypothetical protein
MMLDACAMVAAVLEGCTRMRIIAALALGAALLTFQPILAQSGDVRTYICQNLDLTITRPSYIMIDFSRKIIKHSSLSR